MNRGAIDTRAAFEAEELSQNEAARQVRCDPGNFSKILAAKKLPGRELTLRIWRRFKVSPDRWAQVVAVARGAA